MSTKQNHKKWRKQFNEDCLTRDNHKCVFCDITENLDVHHITSRDKLPNGGYVMSNGITVCSTHHLLCERCSNYQTGCKLYYSCKDCGNFKYNPPNLYKKINSSYEQAYKESLNLI